MNRNVALVVAAGASVLVTGCSDPLPERAAIPQGDDPVELDPADFTTRIDHPAWPMRPGDRWIYRETEDGERLRVVVTVSSGTREIANGVTARVVRDTVTDGGQLIEDTFDWYAQDGDGTVWYLGEDTAEFENGEVTTREGSFEAGVDGALPGVLLPGDPEPGTAYRQEYAEGEAEDNGEVVDLDAMAQVPAGFFRDVLLTKDTITIEPRVMELKFYAPGVGPVLALGVSGGSGREELVRKTTVSDRVAERAGTTPLGTPYG
jgi:hypothetical protein